MLRIQKVSSEKSLTYTHIHISLAPTLLPFVLKPNDSTYCLHHSLPSLLNIHPEDFSISLYNNFLWLYGYILICLISSLLIGSVVVLFCFYSAVLV